MLFEFTEGKMDFRFAGISVSENRKSKLANSFNKIFCSPELNSINLES